MQAMPAAAVESTVSVVPVTVHGPDGLGATVVGAAVVGAAVVGAWVVVGAAVVPVVVGATVM